MHVCLHILGVVIVDSFKQDDHISYYCYHVRLLNINCSTAMSS